MLEELGHETLNTIKGKHGKLVVNVSVIQNAERWRDGNNIFSKHYVTLGNALKGSLLKVHTVHGTDEMINLKPDIFDFVLKGKGIKEGAQVGDHIACVSV